MRALAIDLGAESGRLFEGVLRSGKLEVREVFRFPNTPYWGNDGSLRWDLRLLGVELGEAFARVEGSFDSVGVDAWGVDFVLLDDDNRPIADPFHYRDARTDGVMEKAFAVVPKEEIYEQTGIQFLQFNSLYQLYSMVLSQDPTLKSAAHLLTIPDYFTMMLAESEGYAPVCEFTNLTTTQCFNPRTGKWATPLLDRLGIPSAIFPPIVSPGTVVGTMSGGKAKLITPACHDTGSAVAAIPAEDDDFVFISSGTWSVMGIEVKSPIINEESCRASFTNEGGVGGTYRFCKNVMGLWILQQCRAQWLVEGEDMGYGELSLLAEHAEPSRNLIDPDDPVFLKPGDMPARIEAWLRERDYPAPRTKGAIARVVLESLAAKYKVVLDQLQSLSGRRFERIHVIGGGSQNRLLNHLTAEACGIPVVAGPVEATAIGNILVQLVALGELGSVAAGRRLVGVGVNPTQVS